MIPLRVFAHRPPASGSDCRKKREKATEYNAHYSTFRDDNSLPRVIFSVIFSALLPITTGSTGTQSLNIAIYWRGVLTLLPVPTGEGVLTLLPVLTGEGVLTLLLLLLRTTGEEVKAMLLLLRTGEEVKAMLVLPTGEGALV
jgi:hypothetical protein